MRARCLFLLIAFLVFPAAASAAPNWTEADKDGYGTSTTTASKVWHTLDDGRLTEVFYPDLGTPSVRSLEFVVSDGSFSQRDSQAQNRSVQLIDSRSLTYRQVNEEPGRYRITKTYVTDPARNVLMLDVRLESLTGKKLGLDVVYDPGLGNDYQDDVAEPDDHALLARDTGSPVASAVLGAPGFEDTSSQTTDGDLVQTAQTALTGAAGKPEAHRCPRLRRDHRCSAGRGDRLARVRASATFGAPISPAGTTTSAASSPRRRAPTGRSTTPRS